MLACVRDFLTQIRRGNLRIVNYVSGLLGVNISLYGKILMCIQYRQRNMLLLFYLYRFYSPFMNISLISSRSFIKGGRKPENPGKNHLTIRKQNWLSHM